MKNYKKYERIILENLQNNERKSTLSLFEKDVADRLKPFINTDNYWKEVDKIITELRQIGYDLWSHGYDEEGKHIWGWDYMRMETAGFLQIQFDINGIVSMLWRGNNT